MEVDTLALVLLLRLVALRHLDLGDNAHGHAFAKLGHVLAARSP